MPKFDLTIGKNTYEVEAPDEKSLPEIADTIAKESNIQAPEQVQSQGRPGILEQLGNTIKEEPSILLNSAMKTAGGINDAVQQTFYHPIQTAKNVNNVIQHPVDTIGSYINGRYGTMESLEKTLAYDPIGTLLDVSMIGGGTRSLLKATNAGAKVAEFGKASQAILDNAQGLTGTPEQLTARAEDITQKLLMPSLRETAKAISKNETVPAIREAAKVIKKSDDWGQIQLAIEDAVKTTFNERNKILEANNYKMTDRYIRNLEDFYNQEKDKGILKDTELMQIGDVLAQEKSWYTKNSKNWNRVAGQARKEDLQNITKTLLEKREAGGVTSNEPIRRQAYDILRQGLKEEVEGNNPRVAELNSTYGGLLDAKALIARQRAIIKNQAEMSLGQKAIAFIMNPKGTIADHAISNLENLSKKTIRIEDLMQRAMRSQVRKVIEDAINTEKPVLGLPNLTPKYLQERQAMDIESLGTKGNATNRGIPSTEKILVGSSIPKPPETKLITYTPKYLQERQAIRDTIKEGRSPESNSVEILRKVMTNQTNPSREAEMLRSFVEESHKAAVQAKIKRMMKYK